MSAIWVCVSAEPIEATKLLAKAMDPECGAQVLFLGAVRDINHGKKVVAVSYDAFEPLAEKVLRTIAEEAQQRWGEELSMIVFHRTGRLTVGEVSVLVAVHSRHRDAAYLASRYMIEELKQRVPIWKKEFYVTGETEWLKGHALCSNDRSGSGWREVHSHGPR